MQHLVKKFHVSKELGKEFDIASEVTAMWVNQLFITDMFLSVPGGIDGENRFLIIGSNPYSTQCLKLEAKGDAWVPLASENGMKRFEELCLQEADFRSVQVMQTTPCVLEGDGLPTLAWTGKGSWMQMPAFVCEHLIHTITTTLLSSVCRILGVRGYSKVCHKERCEMVLRHCGYSDAFIEEVMLLIPDPKPRKRAVHGQDTWSPNNCFIRVIKKSAC